MVSNLKGGSGRDEEEPEEGEEATTSLAPWVPLVEAIGFAFLGEFLSSPLISAGPALLGGIQVGWAGLERGKSLEAREMQSQSSQWPLKDGSRLGMPLSTDWKRSSFGSSWMLTLNLNVGAKPSILSPRTRKGAGGRHREQVGGRARAPSLTRK